MFIKSPDLVSACETLNKKIIRAVCIIALLLSSADLVLVFMKKVDCEIVKTDSFQTKVPNNDYDFSISRFAANPGWQELSVSAYPEEVKQ
jgi:hypothetical protein